MRDEPFQATRLWWSKELETLCFCHAVLQIKDINARAAASIEYYIASFSGIWDEWPNLSKVPYPEHRRHLTQWLLLEGSCIHTRRLQLHRKN